MISLYLGVFDVLTNIFKTVTKRLQLPNVLAGMIFAMVGLAITILARRIARAVRKTNNIGDNDKLMISLKVIGLVFMFVALMVFLFVK